MRFDTASLQVTLIALQNTTVSLQAAGEAAVQAAGEVLLREARKAVGLRDHSLADLAVLDHPYARRHGSIRIHTDAPWQVHRQTGSLYAATRGTYYHVGTTPVYEVAFDLGAAPHAEYVVKGTRVMLPRDPLWETANSASTRKLLMEAIVRRLGRDMRGKLGVRFGAGTPTASGGPGGALGVR